MIEAALARYKAHVIVMARAGRRVGQEDRVPAELLTASPYFDEDWGNIWTTKLDADLRTLAAYAAFTLSEVRG